jgi:thiaminase/transcriptional activator TenA
VTTIPFSERLWSTIAATTYPAILAHPFLRELTDGTLPHETFAFYIVQDAHYLRSFARVLSVLAARAPASDDGHMLSHHATNAIVVERALHDQFRLELGIDEAEARDATIAPTCLAYTSFLQARAYAGSFAEGVAAVLPCYWIYLRVGRELVARGSPDSIYQRWIDAYAGPEYGEIVAELLGLVDQLALDATSEQAATDAFRSAARYEWMFWDMAYRRERWPLGD